MPDGTIAADDPRADDVQDLLGRHLTFAHSQSGPEHVHALTPDGLLDPTIAFFSYREAGELLAVGALKLLEPGHGEIKSMHTAQAARGRGIGRAMLGHLICLARQRGAAGSAWSWRHPGLRPGPRALRRRRVRPVRAVRRVRREPVQHVHDADARRLSGLADLSRGSAEAQPKPGATGAPMDAQSISALPAARRASPSPWAASAT